MKIYIFLDDTKSYQIYRLPQIIDGNYWVTYKEKDGTVRNFVNVYAIKDNWVYQDADGQIYILKLEEFYMIKGIKIYTAPLYDKTFSLYSIKGVNTFLVGGSSCDISFLGLQENQMSLTLKNQNWLVQNNHPEIPMYVNSRLTSGTLLHSGDHIFIGGLELIMLSSFLVINNPKMNMVIHKNNIAKLTIPIIKESSDGDLADISIYESKDYFYRSPRFRNIIHTVEISIDSPPGSNVKEELPIILQLGSMLTMGLSSMVTLFISFNSVFSGQKSLLSALPSLVMGGSMLVGMLLIPTLTRKYQKKQEKKFEKLRQEKYLEYLANKKNQIYQIIEDQQRALNENSVSLSSCEDIILHHRRNLWERKIEHDDFLMAHIGIGEIPAKIQINYPEEHFSLDSDNLKQEVQKMAREPKTLKDVPINVSFVLKNICAILGNIDLIPSFVNSILLQFIAFHSYEDVKFVILTNPIESEHWKELKDIPYVWNNEKTTRYYGETKEEKFAICQELNDIFLMRFNDDDATYRNFLPYYVIITDDFQSIRDLEFVKNVMKYKRNVGFSFLIINQRLLGLPNECNSFINVDTNQSGMIENELESDKQLVFQAEFLNKSLTPVYRAIANIPIEFASEMGSIPKSVSFLEMYDVGRVEQLNALNRWKSNNSSDTLTAPVGIDQNGSTFYLDLHEKKHGPHGLVAGMTGSGKSEFIITYILSMAINYHPDDVTFVLIDYKGGGLAGAFENKELGIKLPHLAGTITNLDTVEIKRSLASIESELKRRQRLFNEAREQTNESTINIYKYQKLYHEGIVKTPISHLFIISDEFAELKSQQPEFMAQLISTARIGRSLGVHLILATQKPSGVVDAQIWSNSKFRVCLKVQDRSDSMDMIKVPDAAALSVVGRFYLQVGYNEYFALGQSAWCGAPYYEMDERKKKIDSSLDYINNLGKVVKSIEQGNEFQKLQYKGEELPAILKYLSDLAKKENISTSTLWLPSIPAHIFVSELESKYQYKSQKYFLDEIIGEYDSPSTQTQSLLTLPISSEGNAVVYGASGSGKENFLTTFIYSTITHHSPEEVNFYILDFGAETLRSFIMAPHVGDVVLANDVDKIVNLFKMLDEEIDKRKKMFLNYGGSYNTFIKESETKVPNIVVVINNYDNFKELYPDYDELMASVTRECSKYGIYFVLSSVSSNGVRVRILQNFKTLYCLQMNNQDDYSSVLGNVYRMVPSKKFGRGLVRIGGVFEFQTAYAISVEKNQEQIRAICEEYKSKFTYRAKKIPVLPEHVYYSELNKNSLMNKLVVGIEKESLNVSYYNLTNKLIHLVSGQELEKMVGFSSGLVESFVKIPQNIVFVLDMEQLMDKNFISTKYFYQSQFQNVMTSIYDYIKNLYVDFEKSSKDEARKEKYASLTLVVVGVEKFLKLVQEESSKFEEMIQQGKELEKLKIILIDTVSELKKLDFEKWYSGNVSNNQGIWVGSGIVDQYTIKLSKTPKFCYQEISSKFGYVIKNGIPVQVKLLEGEKKDA